MYKTRVMVFLATIGLVLLGLISRLAYLQLVRGDHYLLQAEKSLQQTEVLPARRGQILDRHGRILAIDKPVFDLCLDYRFIVGDEKWIESQVRMIARSQRIERQEARKVYELLSRNTWELARALARHKGEDLGQTLQDITSRVAAYRRAVGSEVREEREHHPVVTALQEGQAVQVNQQLEHTIGLVLRPSHTRWYPYEMLQPDGSSVSAACHIIGVMGTVNLREQRQYNLGEDEVDRLTRDRLNYRGWDRIGKTGVEKLAEPYLRGKRGYRRLKLGEQVLEDVDAEPGEDIRLTIDIELQKAITQRLLEARPTDRLRAIQTGAIVVLDIPTRDVLAMVSVPLYNLNTFQRDYGQLVSDDVYLPLMNRAVANRYPPGSTIKPIVALHALAQGVIDERTTYDCHGYMHRPGSFRCTGVHPSVAVVEAIKKSCNVYFYYVGEALGAGNLVDKLQMFGMGERPGTGLPDELTGDLPTEQRVMAMHGRGYTPADARFLAIGQGQIAVTPLHVANAIATVAAGGKFISPRLLLDHGPEQLRMHSPIPTEHAEIVRRGMWQVINESGGTGYRHFHNRDRAVLGFDVCGKSGTAEVPAQRVDLDGDGTAETRVAEGNMAWFVGFAPRDKPRVAFAVVVEYTPGHGGDTAGPIAADVVLECKRHGYLP